MASISGVVSSSSREVPYAPASVSGSDVGTARAYNNASAIVSFTAPVHDGGLPVTGYEVTSSPGGFTASGSSSPLTITGLSSSTSYTYNVTATNSIGTGPAITSGSVFATTIPQPVTIGTATATGAAGTVTVAFTANGTGGKTVTYTATSSPGGFTGSSSGSPITVTGLTNGTAYTFTVVASNANGSAAASGASNAATPYTYVAPTPTLFPPGFQSTPVASASGNSVTSTSGGWANGNATSFIYKLYIGQSASGTFVTNSAQVTQTSFTFTGLSYSTNYYVLVEAYNSDGGNSALSNTATTGAAPPVCVTPGSMSGRISASYNTSTQTITWSWSAPSPIGSNNWYQYSINGGPWSSQLGTSVTSSAGYSTNNTIQVYASEFCPPNWNDGGTGSFSILTGANPVSAPGSMAGLVSGYYAGASYFNWSAPSGTAPFTYYYSFNGYGYTSTSGTSASNAGDSTITVYASNSAGSGGSGGASAAAPAPAPYRYYCRTSSPCAGIGNCSDNGGSTSNQTGSGSGYSIACLYNNTATYPACQSTAGATCTGNLSCCSGGLKYICSEYDYSNQASVNWSVCYYTGQCAANSDPAGVRTRCCPPAC
jgi:uncharacterized protein YccT (UPF0319 family)